MCWQWLRFCVLRSHSNRALAVAMSSSFMRYGPLKELHGEANCSHFFWAKVETSPLSLYSSISLWPPCPRRATACRSRRKFAWAEVFRAVHKHMCYQGSLGITEMVMGQDASRSRSWLFWRKSRCIALVSSTVVMKVHYFSCSPWQLFSR